MGFFDKLKDGLASAASWGIDHSAQIIGVVSTVAKVAGYAVLDEENDGLEVTEVDPADPLAGYYNNFLLASNYVTAQAKEPLHSTREIQVEGDDIKSVKHTICGLWSQPAVLDKHFNPPLDLYRDLSAWLGAHGVPPTFKGGNDVERDTALEISNGIFANAPPNNISSSMRGENLVINPSFHIPGKDWGIQGRHAYYSLPLGKGGEDTAWHSAIHFKLTTNQEFRLKSKSEAQELARLRQPRQIAYSSQDSWIVTLQVKWASALFALNIQAQFFKVWNADYQPDLNATTVASAINGANQKLKFGVPANIIPAQVRAAVINAATKASQGQTSASKADPKVPTNSPDVQVTDSSFIPGQSDSGQDVFKEGQHWVQVRDSRCGSITPSKRLEWIEV